MLDLNQTELVKLILLGIAHRTKGVPHIEGHLGAKLLGEVSAGGGAGSLGVDRSGGKRGGRANKDSKDVKLHHGVFGIWLEWKRAGNGEL